MLGLIFAMLLIMGIISLFTVHSAWGWDADCRDWRTGRAWGQAHSRSVESHAALSAGLAIWAEKTKESLRCALTR